MEATVEGFVRRRRHDRTPNATSTERGPSLTGRVRRVRTPFGLRFLSPLLRAPYPVDPSFTGPSAVVKGPISFSTLLAACSRASRVTRTDGRRSEDGRNTAYT